MGRYDWRRRVVSYLRRLFSEIHVLYTTSNPSNGRPSNGGPSLVPEVLIKLRPKRVEIRRPPLPANRGNLGFSPLFVVVGEDLQPVDQMGASRTGVQWPLVGEYLALAELLERQTIAGDPVELPVELR